MAVPISQRIEQAHKYCDEINSWAPQFSEDENAFWKQRCPVDRLRHLLDLCRLCSLISLEELPESHFDIIYDTLNAVNSNLKTISKALSESSLQTATADFAIFINRMYDHEWKEHLTQFRLFSYTVTSKFLLEQKADKHLIEIRTKFAAQKAEVDDLSKQSSAKLSESIQSCQTSIDNLREQMRVQKNEFDAVIGQAKDKVAQAGVAQFHKEFSARAVAHDLSAKNWLYATLTVVLITGGLIFAFFDFAQHTFHGEQLFTKKEPLHSKVATDQKKEPVKPDDKANANDKENAISTESAVSMPIVLNVLVTRVLILSLLTFLLYWCARNYRANCHLTITYRQKELSLRTFEAFAAAAHDKEAKNAILRATTRFIFSASPTGYLGKDETGPSDKLIEILSSTKES